MALGCGNEFRASYPKAPRCPDRCTAVDVHCHVFNGSDLPIKAFLTQIAPFPNGWTEELAGKFHAAISARAPSGAEELQQIEVILETAKRIASPSPPSIPPEIKALGQELHAGIVRAFGESRVHSLERFINTAAMITRPRYQLAAQLVATYPTVGLFVPLLVDYDYFSEHEGDVAETPLASQLRVHAKLCELSMRELLVRKTARLHSFAPFNPMREYQEIIRHAPNAYAPFAQGKNAPKDFKLEGARMGSLNPVRYAVEQLGFIGVKLYPNVGYLALNNSIRPAPEGDPDHDQKMRGLDMALCALYQYCESEDVPITTHASAGNQYRLGFEVLAEPKHWEPVLQRFPRLRLNLGHFGHLIDLEDGDPRGLAACESWMRQAADLIQRYDNVYADMSNSPMLFDEKYRERLFEMLAEVVERYPKSGKRIMYGSDWWMNTLDPNADQTLDAFEDQLGTHLPQEHRQMMGQNAFRFLGFMDENGRPNPENGNAKRLTKHYASLNLAPPEWLNIHSSP